jgi:putative spermidine/putrescine transport system permease protein
VPLLPSLAVIAVLFLYPLLHFFRFSFDTLQDGRLVRGFSFAAYRAFAGDPYYRLNVWTTVKLATVVTVACTAIGYPLAYAIWSVPSPRARRWVSLAVMSPLVVSVVVRAYGWIVLLGRRGAVNYVLEQIGLTHGPLTLVNNFAGVVVATVHVLLPFMVFPLLGALDRVDPTLKEAAADLGASRWRVFQTVTWPLTLHGLAAGAQLVFPLALSAYVTPQLLGGGRVLVLSTLIYQTTIDVNWPIATVASIALLMLTTFAIVILLQVARRSGRARGLPVH